MNYVLKGAVTKKVEREIKELYGRGVRFDYLLLDSPGGDFIAAHNIVRIIRTMQPDLPVVVENKAFSAAAYIFLCLDKRFHFKGASIYIHSIKTNIYTKDINLLLHKRKYYSKLLRERVAKEFNITTHLANKWLRESKAFSDSQLLTKLDSIPVKSLREITK